MAWNSTCSAPIDGSQEGQKLADKLPKVPTGDAQGNRVDPSGMLESCGTPGTVKEYAVRIS